MNDRDPWLWWNNQWMLKSRVLVLQADARKTRLQKQFDKWEASNQAIQEYNEEAPLRAEERKRLDEKKRLQRAIDRQRRVAEVREAAARTAIYRARYRAADQLEPIPQPGGTFNSLLTLLSDHEYIDWMFACFTSCNTRMKDYLTIC